MDYEQIKQVREKYKDLRPVKALRIYCKEICCCGDRKSYVDCKIDVCPLWEFRMSKKQKEKYEKNDSFKKEVDNIS